MKFIAKIVIGILVILGLVFLWTTFVTGAFPFSQVTHYYNFDETSGNLLDQQGSNNGELQGTGGYTVTQGVSGLINTAYNFSAIADGTFGSYVNITSPTLECYDFQCSVSLWANWSNSGARGLYFAGQSTNTGNYTAFFTNTGGNAFYEFENATDGKHRIFYTDGGLDNGYWHHFVGTMNGTDLVFYINGTLIGYTGLNTTTWSSVGGLPKVEYIGTRSGGGAGAPTDFVQGGIDELGIWSRALTASEVTDLYGSGKGAAFGDPIVLNSPANNTYLNINNATFNITTRAAQANSNMVNATLWIWNGTILFNNTLTQAVTGNSSNETIFSFTGLPFGQQLYWNALMCEEDLASTVYCQFSDKNFTLYGYNYTESYASQVTEGQSTGINMNITFTGIDTGVLADLSWNGINSSGSKSIIDTDTIKFSSSFTVPVGTGNVTGKSVDHFWRFWLPDGSVNQTTEAASQTVFGLGADNCTTFSNLLFNFTMYDEDSLTLLGGAGSNSTVNVEVTLRSLDDISQTFQFNQTYLNTTNSLVCVGGGVLNSSNYEIDAQVQYTQSDYVTEFYNLRGVTAAVGTFPQVIPLYPLLSTRSQEFLVTYKDSNFLPVQNAIIQITRKYVGDGVFRTVEAPLTDEDGSAIVHLILSDEIYTINVYQNNILQATFPNKIAYCDDLTTGDCRINLNALSSGGSFDDFFNLYGLSYIIDYTPSSRLLSTTFSQDDNTNHLFNLTGIMLDGLGNQTACSESVTTSSGSLSCTIPTNVGNGSIIATLYRDNIFISQSVISLEQNAQDIFGYTGIIMMLIMFITIPLMMITTGVGIVIGAIVGLVMAAALGLFTKGDWIGTGSAILWFIIAGGILIWKITNRQEKSSGI